MLALVHTRDQPHSNTACHRAHQDHRHRAHERFSQILPSSPPNAHTSLRISEDVQCNCLHRYRRIQGWPNLGTLDNHVG